MTDSFIAPCLGKFKHHDFVQTYICHRCGKSWLQLWEEANERFQSGKKAVFTLQTRPKQGGK